MARIVALIVVAALAAAPASAFAAAAQQETPAQSLLNGAAAPQQQQEAPATQPQQAPASTTADSGSLSALQTVLIAVAVVALIGGIWVVIARDARRATAGRVRTSDAELGGRGGSATRAARRSRKLSAAEKQRRKRGRAS